MNKTSTRLTVCLLVPLIMLNPGLASTFSTGFSMTNPYTPAPEKTSLCYSFEDQALNAASDFILNPPLMNRLYSSRAHRLDPAVSMFDQSPAFKAWKSLFDQEQSKGQGTEAVIETLFGLEKIHGVSNHNGHFEIGPHETD